MDSQIQGVYMTNDLNKFRLMPSNREITSVARIHEKVDVYGWQISEFPIIVTRNLEVLDGQHRLTYAKEKNLPIAYRVSDFNSIQDFQQNAKAQRNWTTRDFIKSFADAGSEPHRQLQEFMATNPLATESVLPNILLGQGSNPHAVPPLYKVWQTATLPKIDYSEAQRRVNELEALQRLSKSGEFKSNAIKSYCFIRKHPEYNFERMLRQFNKHQDSHVFDGSQSSCTRNWDSVYNKRMKNKVSLIYQR